MYQYQYNAVTEKSPHLGILRLTYGVKIHNMLLSKYHKIKKSCRQLNVSWYAWTDNLDPKTTIQLVRTFIKPILTYGLPTSQNL